MVTMPRPHHAQGRPATRVIPADWNTTHSPVVARTLRGRCDIREPGTTQTQSGDQVVAVPTAPYWVGPCRVQALSRPAKTAIAAADPEFVADYLVVVPLEVAPEPGHLVTITTPDPVVAGADVLLPGLVLQVEQVVAGTERFERDLLCTIAR